MKLSPHFDLNEFTASETAARKRIDNTPTPAVVENLKRLCEVLEQVRNVLGRPVVITSGYRSPAVNQAVGGAATSQHCFGLAADITVTGMTPLQVCQAIQRSGIQFDQLIHEFEAWTHISIPPLGRGPRGQTLTYKHGRAVISGIV